MGSRRIDARRWVLAFVTVALLALLLAPVAGARDLKKGSIEGLILNQAGKPVVGATVIPYEWASAGVDWWTWEQVPGVTATTGRNGTYKLLLPAGKYRVLFVPAASQLTRYAIEAYPNKPAPDFGDDIVVKWGTATRRISAVLDPPAHIEGTVRDAANGDPVGDIQLQCIFQGTSRIQQLPSAHAVSAADGHYEVWGLKPYAGFSLDVTDPTGAYWGPWFQNLGDFSFTGEWPAGVRTDDIAVESTDLVKIRGTALDSATGLPLNTADDGVVVNLHEMWNEGGWNFDWFLQAEVAADGTFEFSAADLRMAPMQYMMSSVLVALDDTLNLYYDEWYNDAPYGDFGEPVSPNLGETVDLGAVYLTPTTEDYPW